MPDFADIPMNDDEKTIYHNGINLKYWQTLASDTNRASRMKKRFIELLVKYVLLSVRDEILMAYDHEVKGILKPKLIDAFPPLYLVK